MTRKAVGSLEAFVLDVHDLARAETFWSAVTGYAFGPSIEPQFRRTAVAPGLSFVLQLVPEKKKTLKNRAHLDIEVPDLEAALKQVEVLGGRLAKRVRSKVGGSFIVCADPDGNEFCLVPSS
ncbi:MAG: VOC family protein [Chloroflexi bacterium]|nr:VOC family protein [Chloroflexota bacterium]